MHPSVELMVVWHRYPFNTQGIKSLPYLPGSDAIRYMSGTGCRLPLINRYIAGLSESEIG